MLGLNIVNMTGPGIKCHSQYMDKFIFYTTVPKIVSLKLKIVFFRVLFFLVWSQSNIQRAHRRKKRNAVFTAHNCYA